MSPTQLHDALATLRPKDWSDIPLDDLDGFLRDVFTQAELIINSVPPPPGGDDFLSAKRSVSEANSARSALEMPASETRPPPPAPEHKENWEAWGKPLKLGAKDNPLGISVYKMAGHDRHGAWFARKSVHEGMGFEKWKKAMMQEFPESLAVQGGPGEGNVRGIGSDQRLERKDVAKVGRLEVYQLSAQFPGPVAPREFITLLLTTDKGLTEASVPHVDSPDVPKVIPRHYMVVSIPVSHPDAPPRAGLVRGQYESIEMIREIPLPRSRSPSTDELGSEVDNPELNPVEWIMITRSDPGGGIPRFMVERNVPSSICQDAVKFLDWASGKDEFPDDEKAEELVAQGLAPPEALSERKSIDSARLSVVERNAHLAGVGTSIADNPPPFLRRISQRSQTSGILDTLTSAIDPLLPVSLQSNHQAKPQDDDDADLSSSTESSSAASFASAEQFKTAEELPLSSSDLSTSTQTLAEPPPHQPSESDGPSTPSPNASGTDARYERTLAKLAAERERLDARLERDRAKATRDAEAASGRAQELETKARERHERDRKKQEDKFARELKKLEQRREKEAKKMEEKRRKEEEKVELVKVARERDEWRKKFEVGERERAILKEQVGELQRELTVLVARVGKMENGGGVLKGVREDLDVWRNGGKGARERALSAGSRGSKHSRASSGSGRKKVET